MDRVTNLKMLRNIRKDKKVIRTMQTRKLRYFGFTMEREKYKILRLILEGNICGKRSRDKSRINWLQNLRQELIATPTKT